VSQTSLDKTPNDKNEKQHCDNEVYMACLLAFAARAIHRMSSQHLTVVA